MPEDPKRRPLRVAFENLDLEVEVSAGISLLDAIRSAGLAIDSACGGRGTCGECRVRFLEGVHRPSVEDETILSPEEIAEGWRLACQSFLSTDCRVIIPERTARARRRKIRVLTESAAGVTTPQQRGTLTGYGIAVDIGTTTVVCYLMDLAQARQIGVNSFANPQQAFGPDVISRIMYAHRGPDELEELQRRLVSNLERGFMTLCKEASIKPEDITLVTAVGNTTMSHLFRGIDPWSLGVAPYEPVFLESPPLKGEAFGFRRFAKTKIRLLPNIGGHLGSDITAGVMALDLAHRKGVSLFMDLGTNGEVVLCAKGILAGTSCAAGPVFEGVHVHHGMPAFPGAIERVDEEDGRVQLDTIDNQEPLGICGSGLVDAVALLLRHHIVLPSGRMIAPQQAPADLPEDFRRRLREDESGRSFLLLEDGLPDDILLTQNDIRQVQLAKAPIRSGVEMLLKEAGRTEDEIDAVYVAGGFGSSVRSESLLALGVLPESVRGRIRAVGNTAGLGAKLALTYPERLRETHRIAREIKHVDLVLREDFREAFAHNVLFPDGTGV